MLIDVPHEILVLLEKYIKAGRISFSLLRLDDANKAVVNELLVEYDNGKPIVYIMNPDGTPTPILTQSSIDFQEFKDKIIEISEIHSTSYEPHVWFQLQSDGAGENGYVQTVIDKWYQFIENNIDVIQPTVEHVYINNQRHSLIPFVASKNVFYNMAKVTTGGTIKDLDAVFNVIYSLYNDMYVYWDNLVTTTNTKVVDVDTKLTADNDRQDARLTEMENNVSQVRTKVDNVYNFLNNINNTKNPRIRPFTFSTLGNSTTIYPVIISLIGDGGLPVTGGSEYFLSPFELELNTPERGIMLQLGGMHANTSTNYYTGFRESYWEYTQKIKSTLNPKWYIYDVIMIGPASFLVYLRGNTQFTLWSRYIDYTNVNADATSKGGYDPINENQIINPSLTNNANINSDIVVTFSNQLHVTRKLIIEGSSGSPFSLGIGG